MIYIHSSLKSINHVIPLCILIAVSDHMVALARIICEYESSQAAVVVESKSM